MINRDDSLLFAAEKRAREKRAQQSLDKSVQRLVDQPERVRSEFGERDQDCGLAQPLRAKRRNAR